MPKAIERQLVLLRCTGFNGDFIASLHGFHKIKVAILVAIFRAILLQAGYLGSICEEDIQKSIIIKVKQSNAT